MKKRVLALLCALITAGTSFNYLPALEVKAADTTGKTYYISSLNGNNSRSGTSEKEAWETLDMLYDLKLNPGDQVLLEKGSQFNDSYIHLVDVHGSLADLCQAAFPVHVIVGNIGSACVYIMDIDYGKDV